MAHFTVTVWHAISPDISSNKTDTNNFIFSTIITQKNLVKVVRYANSQHH